MKKLLPAVGLALGMALASVGHSAIKSVVLVHGAFADGSGWSLVAALLEHDGWDHTTARQLAAWEKRWTVM